MSEPPTPSPITDDVMSGAYSPSDEITDLLNIFLLMLVSMILLWMCTNMLCVGDKATLARDERVLYLSRMNHDATGNHGLTDVQPPKKKASWGLTNKLGQSGLLRLGYKPSHGRFDSAGFSIPGPQMRMREAREPSYRSKKELEPEFEPVSSTPPPPMQDPKDIMLAESVGGSFSMWTPSNLKRSYFDDEEKDFDNQEDNMEEGGGEGARSPKPADTLKSDFVSVLPGKTMRYLEDKADGHLPDYIPKPPSIMCLPPPGVGSREFPLARLRAFKRYQWFVVTFLEQSSFCNWWGGFCVSCEGYRQWLIKFALLADIVSIALIVIAMLGISEHENVVKNAPWATGTLKVDGHKIDLWFGLTGFFIESDTTDFAFKDGFHGFEDDDDADCADFGLCGSCGTVSESMISSVANALFSMFPSIFTDVLRMYPHYDVNCQKGLQTIMAIYTIATSMKGFLDYRQKCFNSFESGTYTNTLEDGNTIEIENAKWAGGLGFQCIMLCFIVRIPGALAHTFIPASNSDLIRNKEKQEEYERIGAEEYYKKYPPIIKNQPKEREL